MTQLVPGFKSQPCHSLSDGTSVTSSPGPSDPVCDEGRARGVAGKSLVLALWPVAVGSGLQLAGHPSVCAVETVVGPPSGA